MLDESLITIITSEGVPCEMILLEITTPEKIFSRLFGFFGGRVCFSRTQVPNKIDANPKQNFF